MTVEILVPVSGGKDSQTSLELALKTHDASVVRGLFCDTRYEHPITYNHIEWMRNYYGVQIDTVNAGSVEEQCIKHGRFPGGGARFCTEELKIWPTKRYCKELAISQGKGFEVWYGMRSDESPEREKRYRGKVCDELYPPHEVLKKYPKYLFKLGVMFRLCILDWSEKEVFEFLEGRQNPLYAEGFDRVGCFPCEASGDKWKEKAYQHDDFGRSQYQKMIFISKQINKPVFNSKGGKLRNPDAGLDSPGCALCSI